MPDPQTHLVQDGETASGLAQQYKVHVDKIKEWNHLKPPKFWLPKDKYVFVSDPFDHDESCKELEYDICGLSSAECYNEVVFNGTTDNCDSSTQSCAANSCPAPIPNCTFSSVDLTKGERRLLLSDPNLSSGSSGPYTFEVVAGYKSKPATVKLSLMSLTTTNCPANHEKNVIYAKVKEEYQPVSDCEYSYDITFSYKLGLYPALNIFSFASQKITHRWAAETCDKRTNFRINAYADDKITISFSCTPFKRDWSKSYEAPPVVPVTITQKNPAIGKHNEEVEVETFQYEGEGSEIYKSPKTNQSFSFYAGLEFDDGTEKVELQFESIRKTGLEVTKVPKPDKQGKWETYKEDFEKIKENLGKFAAFKEKLNRLFDTGFFGKGNKSSFNWGVFLTVGAKVIIGNKEIPGSNYCGFGINLAFFFSAGASVSYDFANKALAAVPYIGPGLVALNIGLSEANMGGLVLKFTLSSSFETTLEFQWYKSYENNKFFFERGGLNINSPFAKGKFELSLGVEYQKEKEILWVKIEVQAILKGEISGEAGLYLKAQAYAYGANSQDKEDGTVDIGYSSASVTALYVVKAAGSIAMTSNDNSTLAEQTLGNTDVTESSTSESSDGYSANLLSHEGKKKWTLWEEGSFYKEKIKDLFKS